MSKHVLLVEDEPDLNETISFNLDSEGYEVLLPIMVKMP